MKKLLIALGVIALLLIIGGIFAKKKGLIKKEDGKKVAVETASIKEIIGKVSATGKIYPENEVKMSSDVSGEIVELLVEEGDYVQKGQVLARIKSDDYKTQIEKTISVLNNSKAGVAQAEAGLAQAEAGVAQAQASVAQAKAGLSSAKSQLNQAKIRASQSETALNNAQSEYNRNEKLYKEELISQRDLANAKLQLENARAEYKNAKYAVGAAENNVDSARENVKSTEQAVISSRETVNSAKASKRASEYNVKSVQTDVRQAKTSLEKTVIRAPRGGIISKLNVEKGERVVGTSQMAGTEIMTIANLDNMECRIEVSEINIARVEIGDTCEIEVDAYLDKKFKGVVTKISNSLKNGANAQVTTDQVTNYLVTVNILKESYTDLKDKKFPFRPGMSASVDIVTEQENQKLAIPIQAVTAKTEKAYKKLIKDSTSKTANDKDLKQYVFLVKSGKTKIVPVETGFQDTENIIVTSGLTKGDSVVVAPYQAISKSLKNNEDVQIVQKDKLY